MNPTVRFLKTKFSEYYQSTALTLPERFTRREWGFLFLGESYMQRHLAFKRASELKRFLTGKQIGQDIGTVTVKTQRDANIPAHVYYSSAYYNEPSLQPMPEKVKGWLGADLIFDLDDDHLRNETVIFKPTID